MFKCKVWNKVDTEFDLKLVGLSLFPFILGKKGRIFYVYHAQVLKTQERCQRAHVA